MGKFQITPWQRMGKLVPPQFHQRLWCNQKNCPSVHPCSRRSCTQARQCCSRPVVVQTETPMYQFSAHVALPKSQSIEKKISLHQIHKNYEYDTSIFVNFSTSNHVHISLHQREINTNLTEIKLCTVYIQKQFYPVISTRKCHVRPSRREREGKQFRERRTLQSKSCVISFN